MEELLDKEMTQKNYFKELSKQQVFEIDELKHELSEMHVDKYADGGQYVELEDIADSCQHMRLHMMDQRLPYN